MKSAFEEWLLVEAMRCHYYESVGQIQGSINKLLQCCLERNICNSLRELTCLQLVIAGEADNMVNAVCDVVHRKRMIGCREADRAKQSIHLTLASRRNERIFGARAH